MHLTPKSQSSLPLLTAASIALAASTALAQFTPAKPLAFETVSIYHSHPMNLQMDPPPPIPPRFQILPDGFQAYETTIADLIRLAYIPHGESFWYPDSISGAPPWVTPQFGDPTYEYDIYAKVAPEDLAAWQKQNKDLNLVSTHKEMLEAMLQTMLADRFKLVAHLVPAETAGYALVIGKDGPSPALRPTPPTEVEPRGFTLSEGGVMVPTGKEHHNVEWTFHNATIASLAAQLSRWRHSACGPDPVVDKTGLTGRYNFVLRPSIVPTADDPDAAWSIFPDTPWDVESLGLALVPAKILIQTIVIDHIELPSAVAPSPNWPSVPDLFH